MIQLFNEDGMAGKKIAKVRISYPAYMCITFTDETFIVLRADANDGWGGEGRLEVDESPDTPESYGITKE